MLTASQNAQPEAQQLPEKASLSSILHSRLLAALHNRCAEQLQELYDQRRYRGDALAFTENWYWYLTANMRVERLTV